ncbi:hypothetical protein FACS189450_04000 [Spirochaetia bacterium]|nr:hypothetical protein FACS189450_04000 [Spirochaetia bacterium]
MAEKTIVLTTFGQGETVERISVSLFDVESNGGSSGARNYCKAINKLELKDDAWVFARITGEHEQYAIKKLVPRRIPFTELILMVHDSIIQRCLREVESEELAIALKGVDSEVQKKIFRNLSKRAAAMMKEDMEFMGPVRVSDAVEQQEKMVSIIENLAATGEIVIPDQDEKMID